MSLVITGVQPKPSAELNLGAGLPKCCLKIRKGDPQTAEEGKIVAMVGDGSMMRLF